MGRRTYRLLSYVIENTGVRVFRVLKEVFSVLKDIVGLVGLQDQSLLVGDYQRDPGKQQGRTAIERADLDHSSSES